MGYGVGYRTYHTSVVRGVVTKELGINTPKMLDEATLALDDLIGSPEGISNSSVTNKIVGIHLTSFD